MKQQELGVAGEGKWAEQWRVIAMVGYESLFGPFSFWKVTRQIERLMALSFVFQRYVECLVYD